MHESTFEYLKPTDAQLDTMADVRAAFAQFTKDLEKRLPSGPDTTHVFRTIRDAAMWANIAITRHPDGSPRT